MKKTLIRFANMLNLYQTLMDELDTKPGDNVTVEKIVRFMFIYLVYVLTSIFRKIILLMLFVAMVLDSLRMETIKNQYRQQKKR